MIQSKNKIQDRNQTFRTDEASVASAKGASFKGGGGSGGMLPQKTLKSTLSEMLFFHTWWRYIDGIFMIWTHSVDDLQTFTTYLNNIHPTIKFTSNYSFTSIPFLDVNVSLINGKITTDLYTKPTDKHQYLLQSSCHPKHTKRAIPFSLALRLRRICSSDDTFTKLILTNGDTTCPSLTKKKDVFTTSHVPNHSLPKTLLKQTNPNGFPLLSHIIQPFVLYHPLFTNTSTSCPHLPAAPTFLMLLPSLLSAAVTILIIY